jgi:hypothetical protein
LSHGGDIKEDNQVIKLLLFLEQTSQWLSVHRGNFRANGGNNLPSQEYSAHA